MIEWLGFHGGGELVSGLFLNFSYEDGYYLDKEYLGNYMYC